MSSSRPSPLSGRWPGGAQATPGGCETSHGGEDAIFLFLIGPSSSDRQHFSDWYLRIYLPLSFGTSAPALFDIGSALLYNDGARGGYDDLKARVGDPWMHHPIYRPSDATRLNLLCGRGGRVEVHACNRPPTSKFPLAPLGKESTFSPTLDPREVPDKMDRKDPAARCVGTPRAGTFITSRR